MCGIAGIWHRDGRPVPRSALLAMTTAIAHRGPDGSGFHLAGSLGLGHRRLKVIDLSDGASQPIWLPDRSLYMVYNGEVHNYLELAGQRLSGFAGLHPGRFAGALQAAAVTALGRPLFAPMLMTAPDGGPSIRQRSRQIMLRRCLRC